MISSKFLLFALLAPALAANDWSKPCTSGSCCYEAGDGVNAPWSTLVLVCASNSPPKLTADGCFARMVTLKPSRTLQRLPAGISSTAIPMQLTVKISDWFARTCLLGVHTSLTAVLNTPSSDFLNPYVLFHSRFIIPNSNPF